MAKKSKLKPRVAMPMQDAQVRAHNFSEVALGYTAEMAREEAARCLQCKTPTCQAGCPVEVDCKSFIKCVAEGNFDEAYRVIKQDNSLPAVCGRVCPQEKQCEAGCKLNPTGKPIAIGRLERFTADNYYAANSCDALTGSDACPMLRDDLKVAAIGSGPSSLTFAGYLASRGIPVTVFEALHEVGGVLTYGIPEFRLPKSIVRTEVDFLQAQGVEFQVDQVGGKTFSIAELMEQGYQAVFIGVGAGLPRFMRVPGENLIGVFSANEYLTRVNLMRAWQFPETDTPVIVGKKVTVFGGGNVAMDAARTALRLGADQVRIVYRRTQNEMPARLEEIEHALEEGIVVEPLAAPLEFLGDENGRLRAVSLQRMALGECDASGRCRPEPIEGDIYELETDLAIIGIGTGPNPVLLGETPELALNKWGYIDANPDTGETSMNMVFAGGDIVTGAATVVMAMGAGRVSAQEVARRLGVE